jgi:hypothetical protein
MLVCCDGSAEWKTPVPNHGCVNQCVDENFKRVDLNQARYACPQRYGYPMKKKNLTPTAVN